jgi:hypothetical protein
MVVAAMTAMSGMARAGSRYDFGIAIVIVATSMPGRVGLMVLMAVVGMG